MAENRKFLTGARPSPRHRLAAAEPHRVVKAPPPQFAYVPSKLDMWGNDQYGDCVTAEEAFAKATYQPEIFIDANTVVAWAAAGGFRDGADLTSVMDAMQKGGFVVGSQTYDDGPPTSVDWTNETVLQSAISQGPVKISIDSSALPSGAGNQQGWYVVGSASGANQDHCVSICGFGPAGWLYQQLNVPLPAGLQPTQIGYLIYSWSTIGFVDFAWIKSVVGEAWLRNPTTVGVPPLPGPTPVPPPPGPPPVPPPPPTPSPVVSSTLALTGTVAGFVPVNLTGTITPNAPAGHLGAVNFLQVLLDVLAVLGDLRSNNTTQLLVDVQKLMADLGL